MEQSPPSGYSLEMQYEMPSFVVTLTIFPEGYHVENGTPYIKVGKATG
ncbi:hypothetical protein SH601_10630 [Gracilibacillus sp. S3-1-1]|uniref:Uncharacterized protein n=1 Tax=Gracilibacillus pellucidus TaxID=3095368 RepID=A0ACC6M6P0_9BACI|nr:hypothetical protein [Gracilibacillus sp. S3-1-1]MDX8046437.1 hypothetical protein [Gracilibacillus sp. S3-1-1]